jgi:hypothetical protein
MTQTPIPRLAVGVLLGIANEVDTSDCHSRKRRKTLSCRHS